MARRRGWIHARDAFYALLEDLGLRGPNVGKVKKIGGGLSRTAYIAEVDADATGWPRNMVALVPVEPSPERVEAARREAELLGRLALRRLEFRVPKMARAVEDVLVYEAVAGWPAKLNRDRSDFVPWEFTGRLAAAVHRVDLAGLEGVVGHNTRREHGEAIVADLAGRGLESEELLRVGFEWMQEHLPPAEPAVLLHGDLLLQNLVDDLDEPPGIIDWEGALRGDPAYDLAIVTRGVKAPFGKTSGLRKLITAYTEFGGREVTVEQVRFHEISLHLWWCSPEEEKDVQLGVRESRRTRLRNLLRALGVRVG